VCARAHVDVHSNTAYNERERERIPDNITVREETTAEEIFTTLSTDMLKAKLIVI